MVTLDLFLQILYWASESYVMAYNFLEGRTFKKIYADNIIRSGSSGDRVKGEHFHLGGTERVALAALQTQHVEWHSREPGR